MVVNVIVTYWHWLIHHVLYDILPLHLLSQLYAVCRIFFDCVYLKIGNSTTSICSYLAHDVFVTGASAALCDCITSLESIFTLTACVCTSHTCHLIHKTGVRGSPHWLTASYATLHAATSYPIKTYNVSSDSASHLNTRWRAKQLQKHI